MYVPQKIPTQGIAYYTLGNYNIDSHIVKMGLTFLGWCLLSTTSLAWCLVSTKYLIIFGQSYHY